MSFSELSKPNKKLYSTQGRKEKGVEFGLRALVLQFTEDLSDREMERFLVENLAGKWFCELGLEQKAPDHSYFGEFRKRLGTSNLMQLFGHVRESLRAMGLIKEIFTFVDASQLVSKLSTWDNRDKVIKLGLEKFNNETAGKVTADKQARFGCKGKDKYWYGYKEHTSGDMQNGLINKAAATSAEVTDAQGTKHICPSGGAVYGDLDYADVVNSDDEITAVSRNLTEPGGKVLDGREMNVLADFIETHWHAWADINASQATSLAVCGRAN